MYIETLEKFKMDNPGFIDAKFIYAPHRLVDDQIFDSYLEILKNLRAKFPDFVVGFDLVGQEDLGRPLISFVERLLKLKKINFYFHAGETNWNGMLTDQNVVSFTLNSFRYTRNLFEIFQIDAVLLRSKRIGHGYALTKYPILLDMVRQQNICIEVNPMSNQILKLVRDYRNHPASLFFADNYPIVITSDNPSFWEATPLSHDMYFAFLGIASADQDLRTLKRLILNSIKYSSLTVDEKIRAENKWLIEWNKFVNSNI
jgi:adenosine deaminase CECR1